MGAHNVLDPSKTDVVEEIAKLTGGGADVCFEVTGVEIALNAAIESSRVDGQDEMAQLRGRKLGFVFQSYHLIPTLTALENVMLPMEFSGGANGAMARADHLLESVGLIERRDHYPAQLSGGEQQRVALARAFMMKPAVLLADEPTGNLDSANGRHVLELLIRLNKEEGTTLVLVTHDELLASHAERRIVLRDGLIVEDA